MRNILIINEDKNYRSLVKEQLAEGGFSCREANTKEKAFDILATEAIDLVLCDLNLRKGGGREVLAGMKEHFPTIPLIIITASSNIRAAVEMMKLGAVDYLLKPVKSAELVLTINERLAELSEPRVHEPSVTAEPPASVENPGYIFSGGEFLLETLKQINLVAPTNYSVILYGESGSGKEAFAREIHAKSKRKNKPFVAIDCGALSKELSASTLFGHEKGAFTGAIEQKIGAFESAAGGTVFLDEISNLPYEIQVSLLRVMQERQTRRVGGTKDIPIDVRVIVASNRKLWEACKVGEFREDLYHRFNEFTISIEPLRKRKTDIVFYSQHFLRETNKQLNKKVAGFSDEVMVTFLEYPWPGNLRELRNVVRRSVLITESNEIGTDALPMEFVQRPKDPDAVTASPSGDAFVSRAETDYLTIVEVLKRTGFDKKKAGRVLGMNLPTMNKKIDTYAGLRGFKVTF